MTLTSITQMKKAEMHFGHSTRKWNPKMAPYIYVKKNGICIIDLIKTYYYIQAVNKFLTTAAMQGRKFLFVGTKKSASKLIKIAAHKCDSYFVNHRWLGGMLTNWETIKASISELNELEAQEKNKEFQSLPKKQAFFRKKRKEKLKKNLHGIQTMESLPDVVIIVGQLEELNAVKECRKLNLRTVTILDTDCDPDLADLFVPANDDTSASVGCILQELTNAILAGQEEYKKQKQI